MDRGLAPIETASRDELATLYASLNPAQLRRDLERALERLWTLAAPDPHRAAPPTPALPPARADPGRLP